MRDGQAGPCFRAQLDTVCTLLTTEPIIGGKKVVFAESETGWVRIVATGAEAAEELLVT